MGVKESIKTLESQGYKIYQNVSADKWTKYEWFFFYGDSVKLPYFKNKLEKEQKQRDLFKRKKTSLYSIWFAGHHYGVFTAREIIKFCQSMTKHPRSKGRQFMKHNSNSRVRAKQNNLIAIEDFDNIPLDDSIRKTICLDFD